jgi:hypothetical protein
VLLLYIFRTDSWAKGNTRMKKISVDAIESEMVLAREVCGSSGNILLAKGTPLNPSIGRRLKNWGIPFVLIEGDEVAEETQSVPGVSPEELKSQLTAKFSNVINNPIMKQIFAAVFQFRIQKLKK